ncbi:hypothetical protein H4219_001452 [Mycoemilia scoparia]|uniref:peptidylprolyl isomerase n=1 Tax=Mycoemilia scoparia TaxID=417184 RepID=A0A9W8A9G2_9FUNG|nr:hypothetical protein H4219_001452 [Mycoemilia scoparia]
MVINPRVFLDIEINGEQVGRIIIELFKDKVPKTAENFRLLCTGECGVSKISDVLLHYKSTIFHRVIDGFAVFGGDFVKRNGSGSESIYGGYFDDENFKCKHDDEFLLSMAQKKPNTNGSQFFITTRPAPHLDNKNVVFGRVVRGKDIVKTMEKVPVDEKDRPVGIVKISNCGELVLKTQPKKTAQASDLKTHEKHKSSEGRKGQDSGSGESTSDASSYSSSSSTTSASESESDISSHSPQRQSHSSRRHRGRSKRSRGRSLSTDYTSSGSSSHSSSDSDSGSGMTSASKSVSPKRPSRRKGRSRHRSSRRSPSVSSSSSEPHSSSSYSTSSSRSRSPRRRRESKPSTRAPRSRWEDDRFVRSEKYSRRRGNRYDRREFRYGRRDASDSYRPKYVDRYARDDPNRGDKETNQSSSGIIYKGRGRMKFRD